MTSDRLPYVATSAAAPYDGLGTLPVAVLLDNVRSAYNVGAFFRTADGVRLARLYLTGVTARPPHPGIAKTALGAEAAVPWAHAPEATALLEELRGRGHELAAVETTTRAVDLFDWRPAFPVCVLFGHEVDGLDPALLERCDVRVRLPMRGAKHSLNVATAGGIVLYELLRKFRVLGEPG